MMYGKLICLSYISINYIKILTYTDSNIYTNKLKFYID